MLSAPPCSPIPGAFRRRRPCSASLFTLRANTERPITVDQGTNQVLGVGSEALRRFRTRQWVTSRQTASAARPEGWDGRAAERCVSALLHRFG